MKSLLRLLHAAVAISLAEPVLLMAGPTPASIHSVSDGVELRFNTTGSQYYEIQDSTTLTAWALVESGIPGTGSEVVRTYPTTGAPKRFFKVFALSTPADMALIPSGGFMMGNSFPADGLPDAPPHEVTVSAFYLAKNPVTKTQWDAVRTWAINNGYNDLAAGSGKAGNHPVQTVSWWDCVKYCNARSEQEGLTPVYMTGDEVFKTGATVPTANWNATGYRLPTEAEWEKAARGGLSESEKRFPWGDDISHNLANFSNNGGESYQSGTTGAHPVYAVNGEPYTSPVGSFAANGYGLNDMAGNVWQWCWDWYGTYDTGSPVNPRGAATGTFRVMRGGSWYEWAQRCRTALRNAATPDNTYNDFGFRVARSSGL